MQQDRRKVVVTNSSTQQQFICKHVCECMCGASRLGMDWPSGIVALCAASSMARFMLMGVCWNPGSLIQPSCIENKTKGPAADISMGNLSPSIPPSFTLYLPHVRMCPHPTSLSHAHGTFCAWICCYANDSAHKREGKGRDVKSWLWGKTEREKPIGNKEGTKYKRIPN